LGEQGTRKHKEQIYHFNRIFERAMKRLESSLDVRDEDKVNIWRFVEHLLAKGVSKARAAKYIYHLIVMARVMDKPFESLGRRDVERLVSWINASDYSENTKRDYKIVLKKFFQWLRGCSEEDYEYPEEVKWIKTRQPKRRLLPQALLTLEEIKKLVMAAENPRDKAFILTHYDSGCRIGETLSLRIVNVNFDEYGAVLIVDGKTGPRRVRVIAAAPALASWLSIHPLRDNPNAPLWVGIGTAGRYKPLDYNGARAMLKRLTKKAGVNKRVYTHLLRHTRATELASILTEAQMKEMLGWVQSSDMPSVYVHLSGRDVDNALLKAHGIMPDQEEKTKITLTTIVCPRCKRRVSAEDKFCSACGMVLDSKTAVKLEQERMKADQIMDMLLKDPEVRNLLARKIYELYASSQHPPTS